MKKGWEVKRLGEVCEIGSGNSAPQDKKLFEDGKFPFFRTSDIGSVHIGKIAESRDYLNVKGIKGMRLFLKNTILLPKSGASTFLNHRVMLNVNGYVSSHLATIKADEKRADDMFLFYYLTTIDARELIQDVKYPSLKLTDIDGIQIPLPSLPEQQRIVFKLNALSIETKKLEAIYQQKLAALEELKKTILKKAFNGEL